MLWVEAQLEICARPPAPTRQDVRDALDKMGLEGVGFSVDERGLLLDTDPAHLTTSRHEALASRFRYAVFATAEAEATLTDTIGGPRTWGETAQTLGS
jgi:hypothetical protein